MKSQTRALVRHISPFGNPIKEDNPFSLPPQQFFASSPGPRRNLIFRKKKNRSSSIYPSCRSASDDGRRDFENVESTARSPHFLFFDPSPSTSSSSSSSPPPRPRRLFHLGFLSILRLSSILVFRQ